MKVFISYAREDSAAATSLYEDLKRPGIEPFLDTSDIGAGEKWSRVIENEIIESEWVLALLSNKSLTKLYVHYEWDLALKDGNKLFIPVRLEPCAVPETLSSFQWVDIFPSRDDALRKILRRLNRSRTSGHFEETFSSLGPDNEGWDLSEWSLNDMDHTGRGSTSICGEAKASFNTVTKTASIVLDVGDSTVLKFYRKLNLSAANIMAKAIFRAIIDDGAQHVIDEESQNGESDWTMKKIDLSPYHGREITLKFMVIATDPISLATLSKAWIDDISI